MKRMPLFGREYYWVWGDQGGPEPRVGIVQLFGITKRLSLKGGSPKWNQGMLGPPPQMFRRLQTVKGGPQGSS